MAEPTKRTKVLVRITSAMCAVAWAGFTMIMVHQLWRSLELVPGILIFLILWIGFYHGLFWMFIDRPAELRKKFPITGDEVRRRRKALYDWLNSQGRQ